MHSENHVFYKERGLISFWQHWWLGGSRQISSKFRGKWFFIHNALHPDDHSYETDFKPYTSISTQAKAYNI